MNAGFLCVGCFHTVLLKDPVLNNDPPPLPPAPQGSISTLNLTVEGCHPGFSLSPTTGLCVCNSDSNTDILRCDDNNRYLYLRVST